MRAEVTEESVWLEAGLEIGGKLPASQDAIAGIPNVVPAFLQMVNQPQGGSLGETLGSFSSFGETVGTTVDTATRVQKQAPFGAFLKLQLDIPFKEAGSGQVGFGGSAGFFLRY